MVSVKERAAKARQKKKAKQKIFYKTYDTKMMEQFTLCDAIR